MIYVDKLKIASNYKDLQAKKVGSRNNHEWCHMWSDNIDDLHNMAIAIGMKKKWFQNDRRLPHYDLSPSRRRKAIKLGAKEVGIRELINHMRYNLRSR